MSLIKEFRTNITRRHFLGRGSHLLGSAALASLASDAVASSVASPTAAQGLHLPPKAKQVIYLHMVGGPPQMDLYDYKPVMNEWYGRELPASVIMGQRLTTMTSGQRNFPVAPSRFRFARHGRCGMWVSELLPYTARMVDD